MYLSENLKYLRAKEGINQRALAEVLEVSNGAVGMWENGKRFPDINMIIKIAAYFEVSLDDLVLKDLRPAGLQFSSNLKYLRKSNNYTQADMAQILKIGRSTLTGYELGEKRPSYEGLLNLAEFFGVTVDDLLKKDLSKEGKG